MMAESVRCDRCGSHFPETGNPREHKYRDPRTIGGWPSDERRPRKLKDLCDDCVKQLWHWWNDIPAHSAIKETHDSDLRSVEYPEIVCLCGSTRFDGAYKRERFRLTVEGKIVLTVAGNWKDDHRDVWDEIDDGDKAALDELHLRKIDLADRVHVLNVGGYIGDSTENEVRHALETGTDVSWLEPKNIPEPFGRNGRERDTENSPGGEDQ